MKIKVGNYLIETDSRQFIVKSKTTKKPQEDEEILEEQTDVKDNWKNVAYCTSLEGALKHITTQVMLDVDDLIEILRQLKVINLQIGAIKKALEGVTNE